MTWDEYKLSFGKVYNGEEDQHRQNIFNANVAFIESENAKDHTYTLGFGPFTDVTNEEYKETYLGYAQPAELFEGLTHLGAHEYTEGEQLAASVDWVNKGAVTPVKNQGQCGSCWSFSTTGGLEGAWEIGHGQLTALSEQQFVDCDKSSMGCGGGSMALAFHWAKGQALCTEQSYPYTARDGSCRSGCTQGIPHGGVTGYKSVGLFGILPATTAQLMSAVQQQPVSIAIEADQASFQHYTGGVLSAACGTKLDHGVLLVGYDDNSWLVKNSWGATWGANGYVRLTKNGNECGILNQPVYPVVSSGVSV